MVGWLVSQFDEGLWQQWPSPLTEISFGYYSSVSNTYVLLEFYIGGQMGGNGLKWTARAR